MENYLLSFGLFIPVDSEEDIREIELIAKHNDVDIYYDPTKDTDFGYGTECFYTVIGTYENIRNFLSDLDAESDLEEFEYLYNQQIKGGGIFYPPPL